MREEPERLKELTYSCACPARLPPVYVPCDLPLNMTLSLSAGISVPIHPLDASLYQSYTDIGIGKSSDGCIGSFQSLLSDDSPAGADIILGTPFLRNVYTVFSCESALSTNPTAADGTGCANPTVGLLPLTTDLPQAFSDFDAVRVRSERLGDNAAFGVSYGGSSSSSSGSGGLNTGARIAIGIVVSVVVIIGLFILTLFIARRRHAREAAREDGVGSGDGVWPAEKGRGGGATRSSPGDNGEAEGEDSSIGGDTGAEAGDYNYEGRRVSLSAKEQAQLREAALLHGFYDADLFAEPDGHGQPGRSASARRPARFSGSAAGGAGGAATPSGFGTESTDSRGYGEARRIQRDYLRRHPSLEMQRERDRQARSAAGGGAGAGHSDPSGAVEIEMEERSSSAAHNGEGVAR